MRHSGLFAWALVFCGMMAPAIDASDTALSREQMRLAIERAIPLLERGAAGSADHRECFTCHNLGVPVMALAAARDRGFEIDAPNFQRLVKHTNDFLDKGRENYLKGKGQGGSVLTAGYALWTLEAAGQQPNETTTAVTSYLLDVQRERIHWRHASERPPSAGSDFTATYVALRGLRAFESADQSQQVDERINKVNEWLLTTPAPETEDKVFRLWSLWQVGAEPEAIERAVDDLVSQQRIDGSWPQIDGWDGDAYATSTALAVLLETGTRRKDSDEVVRGVKSLLATQLDDGSWHVVTRAKPIQTYYESGFPHGKDQFISMAATAWAVYSLVLATPD